MGKAVGRTDDFNDHDLKQIETLSGLGLPQDLIAAVLGYKLATFESIYSKNQQAQLMAKQGKAKAVGQVVKTAYDMAKDGKNPALTIFYLKTQARWSEWNTAPEANIKIVLAGSEEKEL